MFYLVYLSYDCMVFRYYLKYINFFFLNWNNCVCMPIVHLNYIFIVFLVYFGIIFSQY